jgi:uncharacterized flavoprotein (TIGR03862 family)
MQIAIIGGGPGGLMAAEILARAGACVTVYEKKPTLARKFLMAGRGGLNITHSELFEKFLSRYGEAASFLEPALKAFPPEALREWCAGLGQETFTGSSGRVFPKAMKASPLLRAWQERLFSLGVRFALKTTWQGWDESGDLVFTDGDGNAFSVRADAVLLSLGGASWPKLGSDGSWTKFLTAKSIPLAPLRPANCGFLVSWSDHFQDRFAGTPLKPVTLHFAGKAVSGDIMISRYGIEGGSVYALSSPLRDAIEKDGGADLILDLRPGLTPEVLTRRLNAPRKRESLSNFLRKAGGLSPAAIAVLRETTPNLTNLAAAELAQRIKSCPLHLTAPAPIERAISSAGGIRLSALDENFMLRDLPGVFAVGEMLDWEAPTGGYLLQATFSTAVMAARGILKYLGLTPSGK